eukprot:1139107-Pelagomonas_calceolata.AAC.6
MFSYRGHVFTTNLTKISDVQSAVTVRDHHRAYQNQQSSGLAAATCPIAAGSGALGPAVGSTNQGMVISNFQDWLPQLTQLQ